MCDITKTNVGIAVLTAPSLKDRSENCVHQVNTTKTWGDLQH